MPKLILNKLFMMTIRLAYNYFLLTRNASAHIYELSTYTLWHKFEKNFYPVWNYKARSALLSEARNIFLSGSWRLIGINVIIKSEVTSGVRPSLTNAWLPVCWSHFRFADANSGLRALLVEATCGEATSKWMVLLPIEKCYFRSDAATSGLIRSIDVISNWMTLFPVYRRLLRFWGEEMWWHSVTVFEWFICFDAISLR